METLKHHWSPTQTKILLALKDELKRCPVQCIETSLLCDAMSFYYDLYCKKGDKKAFFEVWHESCQMLPLNKDYYYHRQPETSLLLPIHLVCQTAAGIFFDCDFLNQGYSRNMAELCYRRNVFPLYSLFSRKITHFSMPHLPERLQDKSMLEAIKSNDPARLIFLYDSSPSKGEKLKNIYNILLNNQNYNMVMTLHQRFGGLEQIPADVITVHLVCSEKHIPQSFADYASQLKSWEGKSFWERFFLCDNYPRLIRNGLKAGISPDLPLGSFGKNSVSLRQWISFIDELKEYISEVNSLNERRFYYERSQSNFIPTDIVLKCTESFAEWKKEQMIR